MQSASNTRILRCSILEFRCNPGVFPFLAQDQPASRTFKTSLTIDAGEVGGHGSDMILPLLTVSGLHLIGTAALVPGATETRPWVETRLCKI
jgi:hypothetical protein